MSDRRSSLARTLESLWYQPSLSFITLLLLPLSWLFRFLAASRRDKQRAAAERLPVPVIVVGNITVGGTGKTPLIQSLVPALQQAGYRPGIISRGYGAACTQFPARLPVQADPQQYGDEPALLALTGVPVVIDPDRVRAAKHLLATTDCNVIVSDDGLQHYLLARDVEIIVLDGARGLGNRQCLPAGPLREPPQRLQSNALLVSNGKASADAPDAQVMTLQPLHWRQLNSGITKPLQPLPFTQVHAVAGIGNPQRFFDTLAGLGVAVIPHAFADHHAYQPEDVAFGDNLAIVMTAKDAIKCAAWANDKVWVLDVQARLPQGVLDTVLTQLDGVR
ncbi:MAG: tetraacyldisaccharide 4'-kinase [Gammaproteobacteria bacterium]|nr:MAG: tetraacyldisaccharide 4'-kinase [Gammaproteobacteria bacterium]